MLRYEIIRRSLSPLVGAPTYTPRHDTRLFEVREAIYHVVVLTVTHRYNAVRGHRTGSNNHGTSQRACMQWFRRMTSTVQLLTHSHTTYTSITSGMDVCF